MHLVQEARFWIQRQLQIHQRSGEDPSGLRLNLGNTSRIDLHHVSVHRRFMMLSTAYRARLHSTPFRSRHSLCAPHHPVPTIGSMDRRATVGALAPAWTLRTSLPKQKRNQIRLHWSLPRLVTRRVSTQKLAHEQCPWAPWDQLVPETCWQMMPPRDP